MKKGGEMRILIAEDDFVSRRILKAILSRFGDCDIVVDGEEAVQAFRMAWEDNSPYDLLCLDIMMPVMDGQEALERIRAHEKDIGIKGSEEVRVVMVTALDTPKDMVKAYYDGGATAYLVKPITKNAILATLDSLHVNVGRN
jgi:two-component system chemotaxis response regulator CheY